MPTGTDTHTSAPTPPPPASAGRRPAKRAADERVVEQLEGALFGVARTILRLGIPAHALRPGEHIDRSAYWMLKRLDESADPLRLSDLAGLLELDLSTVSRQARQLVDGGMMTRVADPFDGRACRVSVSERGREVLGAVSDARHDMLRQAMAVWQPDERAALAAALTRLAQDMQSAPAGGAQ
jgi:DNA-binding MarR family transcriptional regulator